MLTDPKGAGLTLFLASKPSFFTDRINFAAYRACCLGRGWNWVGQAERYPERVRDLIYSRIIWAEANPGAISSDHEAVLKALEEGEDGHLR